jgi:hypothetical protein
MTLSLAVSLLISMVVKTFTFGLRNGYLNRLPISCVPFSCVFGFLPVLVPFRATRNWVVPVRASSFIGLSPQWYNVLKGSNLYLYLNSYWLRKKLL